MKNRITAPAIAVAAVVALSGCNLLDVTNPNSLVEESIMLEAAANGVVNGSLNRISNGISDVWEGYLVTSDELYWIGSRDAWGQLDQGYVGNPENEFLDGAFPSLGQGVWMAQNAVEILTEHAANSSAFAKDLARAQLYNGMMLMVTGEVQEDMTFSMEPGLYDAARGIGINPSDNLRVTATRGVRFSSVPFTKEWSFLTL